MSSRSSRLMGAGLSLTASSPQLLTCLLGRLCRAGPDIEDPAGPSDGHVTDTQVAITECDPTADPNDVSMRLEQIAKPGRAVKVNRETGGEQRDRRLRQPLTGLTERDIGERDNKPAVGHSPSIAVMLGDPNRKDDAGLCAPLQDGPNSVEKAAGLRIRVESSR